jgi:hypothetical protein
MVIRNELSSAGIIDAIKPGDYGFIKPADQPDQIYFRVDDFVDENVTPKEVRKK